MAAGTSPYKQPGLATAATPQRGGGGGGGVQNLLDFDIPPAADAAEHTHDHAARAPSRSSPGSRRRSARLRGVAVGQGGRGGVAQDGRGDAEKRVGACMEQLREARAAADALAAEREVLGAARAGRWRACSARSREEIVRAQREREELEARLDESEKRRDAAETMAQEAESKMAGMRAGRASAEAASGQPGQDGRKPPPDSNREVEIAVERVARELHALYKSKHETKVAALEEELRGAVGAAGARARGDDRGAAPRGRGAAGRRGRRWGRRGQGPHARRRRRRSRTGCARRRWRRSARSGASGARSSRPR